MPTFLAACDTDSEEVLLQERGNATVPCILRRGEWFLVSPLTLGISFG